MTRRPGTARGDRGPPDARAWQRRPGPGSRHGDRPFRILHQDPQLVVVDKDAGILSTSLPGLRSPSVQALLERALERQHRQVLVVHRIDRYTSGLLLFATTRRARDALVAQFRDHRPERLYLALVRGVVEPEQGTLRHRLQQTRDGFRQLVVAQGGTEAVLHYRVRERLPAATVLEVQLATGLKNQIRTQLCAIGHPLVGDGHYDPRERDDPLGRQALHAWRLALDHPGHGGRVQFEAPLPADLAAALARLRRG